MKSLIILTEKEIKAKLSNVDDWTFKDNRLTAGFQLADFDQAMEVVSKVADVAREMDHHPFWSNVYSKLAFSLCTHSVGDKVTILDIQMANKISEIIEGI